jgi:serine/threonine protein phosphatase 1
MSETDLVGLRDALVEAMGEHLEFLRSMPLMAQSGDVVLTHAGVARGDGEALGNHRRCSGGTRLRTRLARAGQTGGAWALRRRGSVDRPGRICVDTGAYYSGRLTAVRLDEGVEFLSVTNKGSGPMMRGLFSVAFPSRAFSDWRRIGRAGGR